MPRELAQLLVDEGVVGPDGVERALARQREAGGALDTALLELGLVAEDQVVGLLARASDLPAAPLSAYEAVDARARRVFPSKVAERHGLAPFALDGRELSLVATHPLDLGLLDEISFMLSLHLTPHVGPEWRVRSLIQRLYGGQLPPRLARLAASAGGPVYGDASAAPPGGEAPAPEAASAGPGLQEADPASVPAAPRRAGGFGGFRGSGDEPLEPLAAALAQAAEAFELDWEAEALSAPLPAPAPPDVTEGGQASLAPEPWTHPEPLPEATAGAPAAAAVPPGPALHRSAPPRWSVGEARAAVAQAASRDEVVLAALRYARDFFQYAALFAVTRDAVAGHDALGPEDGAREVVRTVALYVTDPGIFRTTLDTLAPYLGPVARDASGTAAVLDGLGRGTPRTALVFPVLLRGRPICILYADNGEAPVSARRLGDLLLVLSLVGGAFERIIRVRKGGDPHQVAAPRHPAPEPEATAHAPVSEPPAEPEAMASAPMSEPPPEPEAATHAPGPEPLPELEAATHAPGPEPLPELEAAVHVPGPEAAHDLQAEPEQEPAPQPEAAVHVPEPEPAPDLEAAPAPPADWSSPPEASPPQVTAEPMPEEEAAALPEPTQLPPEPVPEPASAAASLDQPAGPPSEPPDAPEPPAGDAWPPPPPPERGPERPAQTQPDPVPVVVIPPAPPPPALADVEEAFFSSAPGALPEALLAAPSRPARAIDPPAPSPDPGLQPPADGVSISLELTLDRPLQREASAAETPEAPPAPQASPEPDVPPEIAAAFPALQGVPGLAPPDVPAQAASLEITLERPLQAPAPTAPRDPDALVGAYLVSPRGGDERAFLLGKLVEQAAEAAPILCEHLPGPLDVAPEALASTPAPDQGPVFAAVAALGPAALRPLLGMLADRDGGRRRAAAALLGQLGDPAAFLPLTERCFDQDPAVAEAARAALALHRRDPGMKPVPEKLRRALLSGLADKAAAAARAIAALRDAESIPLLIQALEGSDAGTAAASADALAAITLQRHGVKARDWLMWWKQNRGRSRTEWLFGALTSGDRDLRLLAANELREAAASPVTYSADLPEAERLAAAQAWQRWFQKGGHRL